MKKFLATILSLCMIVSMLVIPSYAEGYTAPTSTINLTNITNINDYGTANDIQANASKPVYKITDVAGLFKLAEISETSNLVNNTFYLANDIGSETSPIKNFPMIATKNVGNGFAGRIDGLGHTIDYLTIDFPEVEKVGLIVNTDNWFGLKNLRLGNHCTITGKKTVGSIIAEFNCTNGYLDNVYSAATVTSKGDSRCGGLVGNFYTNPSNAIRNCTFAGNVKCGWSYAGGIIGIAENNYGVGVVTNCLVAKEATITNAGGGQFVGGVLGYLAGAAQISITNCRNEASVFAQQGNAGGIIAAVSGTATATVEHCTNYGTITGRLNIGTGGIVGRVDSAVTSVTVNNCVNHGTVTGTGDATDGSKYVAGIIGNNRSTVLVLTNNTNRGALKCIEKSEGILYGIPAATDTNNVDYSTVVQLEGYQVSKVYTNEQGKEVQDIRFVASIDSNNYQKAGFTVTVTGDGVNRTFEKDCQYAYTQLYENLVDEVNIINVANYREGGYFIAYAITGIPVDQELTFAVATYAQAIGAENAVAGEADSITYVMGTEPQ